VIVPPTGNETISMLKTSSLVSVIAVADLTYAVQLIYATTYQVIPMLIVASIWYLFLTSLLSIGQFYIERYFGRGRSRLEQVTLLGRIRANFWPRHARVDVPDEPPTRGEDHR
jgi:polar amino acid transport system permease protein